jgi:L-asparagine transporter-like permease
MIGAPFSSYLGIALILFAISGAAFQESERIGLFISFGVMVTIFISYLFVRKTR